MNETMELAGPQRRRRRSRDEVIERLHSAARQLFAERGYAAATTKEIARLADVSETLIFRHFGGKAGLFDEVVSSPFLQLMQQFIADHAGAAEQDDRSEEGRRFTAQVFELFDRNERLFSAAMSAQPDPGTDEPRPFERLDDYFEKAVVELNGDYARAGQRPDFDLEIGVRIVFGMIASSVLLRNLLFPSAAPDKAAVAATLERLVERALQPAARGRA
jgi:AcrR family transcriptional regulator